MSNISKYTLRIFLYDIRATNFLIIDNKLDVTLAICAILEIKIDIPRYSHVSTVATQIITNLRFFCNFQFKTTNFLHTSNILLIDV